ncbi:CRP-like cAMP-binding protein [Pseudochelatococcus lubricantis]|uniref:CRP-like cAMP-binding protein n=1 Tax=Pseudochelatococcus lubricantis TaxID=1538102 RepID=A0ABX0V9B8_9HYPH|nr:Crp/Fnr family transcriptional regulator [Pseudochelatococcus lubricantis]NIJ59766.1 CRP-like cAMP-binding protein [Pseudochelatococcus lubricantis]
MAIDISLVRALPLFSRVSDAELSRLMTRAAGRRVPKGEAVFEQGKVADTFYLLLHGRLKVSQVTPDGQQVMVRIVHPGDLFGFARALNRPDYPGTARAAVDSIVVGWPMSDWDAVVEANPRLAINAMQTIGERLDEAHTRLREMSTQEVERRIAHAVLRLAEKAGRQEAGGTRIDFPITRQDIAEMTGTTLHTVSRTLSAWEGQGLVESGRQKLTVCDADGLTRIADGQG